jgi:Kef-type K+ transport system membrane component KefB
MREKAQSAAHLRKAPFPFTPFFFVSFGLAGDGLLRIGSIMLILALTVVILRHDHGRFEAKKFTKASKAQLKP